MTVSGSANAAPAPGPGAGKPASVGGPATGSVSPGATRLSATGIDLCAQVGYNAGFRGNPLVTS